MREAVFEFELLTPAILAGADQQSAEMRIPSIRGVLRWWTRFLFGEEYEDEIFGFVHGKECSASTVQMRLIDSHPILLNPQKVEELTRDKFDYFLWSLQQKAKEGNPPNTRGALDAGSRFTVSCKMKPDCDMWSGLIKAFLLFGSLGTRSRRAYGSIWPVSVTFDGERWEIPQNLDDLKRQARIFFDEVNISIYSLSGGVKNYKTAIKICEKFLKTLRCGKTQRETVASKWGENDHDAGLAKEPKIYRAALGLPLMQRYSSGRSVEYSINGLDRLASPLHFKIVKLQDGYVPLLMVIPEYIPEQGSVVKARIKNGNSFDVSLDRELLDDVIRNPERLKEIFPDTEKLVHYVIEE